MKYTLLVCVQAERITTQAVRRSYGQRALQFLRGGRGAGGEVIAADTQPLSGTGSDLASALERSIANVGQIASKQVSGWNMEVKLGLAFAQLGVLQLANVSLSASNLSAIAEMWVRERLHLDPAAQELRWRLVSDRHLLVFCAPKSLLDSFTTLAARESLRLTSFLPAALDEVVQRTRWRFRSSLAPSRVLVWTESAAGSDRIAAVQMFHLQGRQLRADWRGWLPANGSDSQADEALQGALARFLIANEAAGAAVEQARWAPASVVGAAL